LNETQVTEVSLIDMEVGMHARAIAALVGTVAASAAVMVGGGASASAEPLHYLLPQVSASPPTTSYCELNYGYACYTPAQLEQAYNMPLLYRAGLTGAGETIAIVDAYGSPTIQSDLATFDAQTGLPAPPSFSIIQPAGPVPPFDATNSDFVGWAEETSLDVEYAHAMAPGANILLVETPVDETEGVTGFPQIVMAENYVIAHHLAGVITQSFGATEQTFPNAASILALRSAYINAAANNVTVLAASGDAGATDSELNGLDYFPYRAIDWPSSDPLVTSVGGTQLHLNAAGFRTAPDNVWNDQALFDSAAASGGGQSTVFSRPVFQNSVANVVGGARGTPDVSMSAAVDGGADVYLGFTAEDGSGVTPGWYVIGGTSEASPLFSGIVAIADQAAHHWLGPIDPTLYALGDRSPLSGIVDITSGNNTVTFTNSNNVTYTVNGFVAGPGYDMASGLGTADGPRLVAELALSSFR
jgi:subtilase family serine protease